MVKWQPDPYAVMLKQFNKRYPKIKATVFVDSPKKGEKKWLGQTLFPDDGFPMIRLNSECTLAGSIDILAHELAHLVTGWRANDGHTHRWHREYRRIYREWAKEIKRIYKEEV